jgi:hypothetical protein
MQIIIDREMLREILVFWVDEKMSNYKQRFSIVGDVDFMDENNISIQVISLGEDEDE